MLGLLAELFVRSLRIVRIAVIATIIVVVGLIGYGVCVGVSYVKAAAKIDNAKMELYKEVNSLTIRADSKLVIGWKQVAEDYCTERELGQIDGKLGENSRAIGYLRIDDQTMALQIAMTVYTSVTAKLRNNGQCALDNAVRAEMDKDVRIQKLWNIETASNVLHGMPRRIEAAKDLHGLENVQAELKGIKEGWSHLFETDKKST